jgi:hypothetical protein
MGVRSEKGPIGVGIESANAGAHKELLYPDCRYRNAGPIKRASWRQFTVLTKVEVRSIDVDEYNVSLFAGSTQKLGRVLGRLVGNVEKQLYLLAAKCIETN